MKNISRKAALLLAFILVMALALSACSNKNVEVATGDIVDSFDVKAGSEIEYTFSIADSHQNISGLHFEFFFDTTVMKVKEVNADNLPASTINDNQNNDGRITVVNGLVNGSRGLECKEKTDLVTITFDVIKDGDGVVKYYIPYMYDYDIANISNYTLTQTYSVDGKAVTEDTPPVLAEDKDFEKINGFDKGDFVNTKFGKVRDGKSVEEDEKTKGNNKYEYTLSVAGIDKKISYVEISLIYDEEMLELDDIKLMALKDAEGINYDKYEIGEIVVNKSFEEESMPDFSAKTDLFKLVLSTDKDASKSVIKYFDVKFCAENEEVVENYTLTAKTVFNGKTVSDAAAQKASDNEVAELKAQRSNASANDEGGADTKVILTCVGIGVAVLALVAIIVVKIKKGKTEDTLETVDLDKL